MGCQICSSNNHETEKCGLIGKTRIIDSILPQRAFLTIPTELEIRRYSDQVPDIDVLSTVCLAKGTQFGPFDAPKNKKFNPNCAYKLPIFYKSRVLHYLDTTNLSKCNWMSLVQFTNNESLRNTICYQLKNEIFFSLVVNVQPGQPLLVGYSPGYVSLLEQVKDHGNSKPSTRNYLDQKRAIIPSAIMVTGSDDSDAAYDHDYVTPIPSTEDGNNDKIPAPDSASSSKNNMAIRSSYRLRLKKSRKKVEQKSSNSSNFHEPGRPKSVPEESATGTCTTQIKETRKRRRNCYPLRDVEIWQCKFCQDQLDTISSFAQHLTTHYKNFKSIQASAVNNIQLELGSTSSSHSSTQVLPYTCDICTVKPYNRLESIISHLRIAHAEDGGKDAIEDFIKCQACRQYFANDSFYKSHVCTPPTISCAICHHSFDNRTDLKYHSAEHSEKDFTCSRCNKILTNTSFGTHVSVCETVRALSENFESNTVVVCSWTGCQKKDLGFRGFQDHLAEHTHPFCCSICFIRLKNPKEFNLHRCQKFECDVCPNGVLFDSIRDLKKHFSLSHPDYTGIQCLECTLPFATMEGYERHGNCEQVHQLKHASNRSATGEIENVVRFVCEVCGATYSNMSSLKTHRSTHSGRRFVCTICAKSFSRKALLQDHNHVHGDPKFSCSVCGKRVKTLKSLSVHKLIHSEFKPFSCDICSKGFAQKINLQSHLRSHLPVEKKKQEICDQCGNAFSSREYLKLHLETHKVGEKFCCDICDAQFIRPYLLHQHKKTVHGNDVYKCEFCDPNNKVHFRQKYSLHRHLLREHSEAKELWEAEGYLNTMFVPGDGSLSHPKTKKPFSQNKDDEQSASTMSDNLDPNSNADGNQSVGNQPSRKKQPRLSTKLSKLLEKDNEERHLIFETSSSHEHEMPEDLEIQNEVIVGDLREDDDSCRTELTLSLDDDVSELYTKGFTEHSDLKQENMVLLQLDDSGRYIIAFSHDLNLK